MPDLSKVAERCRELVSLYETLETKLPIDEDVATGISIMGEVVAHDLRELLVLLERELSVDCPRVLCETWTPGQIGSPDGPPRHVHSPCIFGKHHPGRHRWGVGVGA